jgi:N-acetylglucosaminyldiphosphoundecaprenol N-acetyl-beta-D-mannosaminyltransferase
MEIPVRFERIMGVRFVVGNASAAIDRVCREGGLVVMPSGPALTLLSNESAYKEAILAADLVLPDSALMVLVWNLTHWSRIFKLSGLRYLRLLIRRPEFSLPGASLWVMPAESSAQRNKSWLRGNQVGLGDEHVYVAPIYQGEIRDAGLLRLVEDRHPAHVVLALAGGTQERLGLYLKRNLSYRPAIHCVGAAIAFLSGDQVRIPVWVDRAGLGWLWRSASNPLAYVPRYWAARRLVAMMLRFGDELPSAAPHAPVPVFPGKIRGLFRSLRPNKPAV